jgi:hypothetical protein
MVQSETFLTRSAAGKSALNPFGRAKESSAALGRPSKLQTPGNMLPLPEVNSLVVWVAGWYWFERPKLDGLLNPWREKPKLRALVGGDESLRGRRLGYIIPKPWSSGSLSIWKTVSFICGKPFCIRNEYSGRTEVLFRVIDGKDLGRST